MENKQDILSVSDVLLQLYVHVRQPAHNGMKVHHNVVTLTLPYGQQEKSRDTWKYPCPVDNGTNLKVQNTILSKSMCLRDTVTYSGLISPNIPCGYRWVTTINVKMPQATFKRSTSQGFKVKTREFQPSRLKTLITFSWKWQRGLLLFPGLQTKIRIHRELWSRSYGNKFDWVSIAHCDCGLVYFP